MYFSNVVDDMAPDDLKALDARASAAMLLTGLSRNILTAESEVFFLFDYMSAMLYTINLLVTLQPNLIQIQVVTNLKAIRNTPSRGLVY